jgi:hypothetical protein
LNRVSFEPSQSRAGVDAGESGKGEYGGMEAIELYLWRFRRHRETLA